MSEKDKGSIAAQAWNATKADGDPEYRGSAEIEFWNKIDNAAEKAISTGTATTNFEKKAQELSAKDKATEKAIGGPMAVVEEPAAITAGGGTGPASTERQGDTAKSKAEAKPDAKKVAAAKTAQKQDKSGHVPTGKEAAAIVKEQANAPKHP